MPGPVRQLLLHGAAPSSVPPMTLLRSLRLPRDSFVAVKSALDDPVATALCCMPGLLSVASCAALRSAVKKQRSISADTIDGGPSHQLRLSQEELGKLIGSEQLQSLLALPATYLQGRGQLEAIDYEVDILVRYYSQRTRPWVPFHVDGADITVNVALAEDAAHSGGQLLVLCGGSNQYVNRREGDAVVHASRISLPSP